MTRPQVKQVSPALIGSGCSGAAAHQGQHHESSDCEPHEVLPPEIRHGGSPPHVEVASPVPEALSAMSTRMLRATVRSTASSVSSHWNTMPGNVWSTWIRAPGVTPSAVEPIGAIRAVAQHPRHDAGRAGSSDESGRASSKRDMEQPQRHGGESPPFRRATVVTNTRIARATRGPRSFTIMSRFATQGTNSVITVSATTACTPLSRPRGPDRRAPPRRSRGAGTPSRTPSAVFGGSPSHPLTTGRLRAPATRARRCGRARRGGRCR